MKDDTPKQPQESPRSANAPEEIAEQVEGEQEQIEPVLASPKFLRGAKESPQRDTTPDE
jgi:hypothetical protein